MVTIHIGLLNEGLPVYRPIDAIKLDEMTFQIVSVNSDAETEEWEFATGDTVVCEKRFLSNGRQEYVAVSKSS